MASTFAEDGELQRTAILILWLTGPVEREYVSDLARMSGGYIEQGRWSAARAAGTKHWKVTVCQIVKVLQTPALYQRLRFTLPVGSQLGNFSEDDPIAQEEPLCNIFRNFHCGPCLPGHGFEMLRTKTP